MRGKVEQLTKESSKSGEYLRISIDGENYSVWDTEYIDSLRIGDNIDFEYKESGKWKNITELEFVDTDQSNNSDREYNTSIRNKYITKLSCVKSASNVLANLDMEPEGKGEKVLSLARSFEKYIYEDDL